MNHFIRTATASALSAFLFGCASPIPSPDIIGLDKASLLQKLGKPLRESIYEQGERWDYSRGPDGLNTYFIYIDKNDKVSRYEQVLTDTNFDRIKPGMTKAEVIQIIGDPPKRHSIGRDRGYVWSYRSFSTICIWFQVEFSTEDVVRSAGYNRRPSGIPCR